jgi:hypothetical protein
MRVRCIKAKGVKYLLQDHIYVVKRLHTRQWGEHNKFITLLDGRYYSADKFETLDGKPFPDNYTNTNLPTTVVRHWNHLWEQVKCGNIKVGSAVQCKNMNLKTIKYGQVYTIEEIFMDKRKFKVKGLSTKFTQRNFEVPDKQKARKNSLAFLLGTATKNEKEPIEIIMKFIQEYKLFAEKKKIFNYGVAVEDMIIDKTNFDKETVDKIKDLKIGDLL